MMFVLWWRGGRFLRRAAAKTNVMLLPQKLVVTASLFFSLTRETLLSWKKKCSCVGENINCVVSKWSKVDPNIAPSPTCIGVYWKWSRLQKDPIIILLAPPALVAKWQGKSNKLRRRWWLIKPGAWFVWQGFDQPSALPLTLLRDAVL